MHACGLHMDYSFDGAVSLMRIGLQHPILYPGLRQRGGQGIREERRAEDT